MAAGSAREIAMSNLPFDRAGDTLLTKYQELIAQGHPPNLVEASLKRCVRWSERLVKDMREDIREDAFMALLTDNLKSCEDWIVRFRSRVEA